MTSHEEHATTKHDAGLNSATAPLSNKSAPGPQARSRAPRSGCRTLAESAFLSLCTILHARRPRTMTGLLATQLACGNCDTLQSSSWLPTILAPVFTSHPACALTLLRSSAPNLVELPACAIVPHTVQSERSRSAPFTPRLSAPGYGLG